MNENKDLVSININNDNIDLSKIINEQNISALNNISENKKIKLRQDIRKTLIEENKENKEYMNEIIPKQKEKFVENNSEINNKEGNISKIINYQQSEIFGSLLISEKIYSEDELNTMSEKKVYDILIKTRNKIKKDHNINSKIYKNIVKNGTNMLEMFVNPFYDVKGLSRDLNSEENIEFWTCMEEIRIEYFSSITQEPPLFIKLLSIIGFTMYTRHTMNMLEKIRSNIKEQKEQKEIPKIEIKPVIEVESDNDNDDDKKSSKNPLDYIKEVL